MKNKNPDHPKTIDDVLGRLPVDVRNALVEASAILAEDGIPHAVLGGIAVTAHGYTVNTSDVDFLIRDVDFFRAGRKALIATAPGPTEYRGAHMSVRVDYLSGHTYPGLPSLETAVVTIQDPGREIPIIDLFPLLYMKLSAWRPKDHVHVIGLLNAGAVDLDAFRSWLRTEAKDWQKISQRLDQLVRRAREE